MKIKYFFPIFLMLVAVFVSCKKDNIDDDYNKSYAAWTTFKSSVNNSYVYSVVTNSWTGHKTETIITVKNGKVIQRAYTVKQMDGNTGVITIKDQWTEDVTQLNSHQTGAAILTLDEIYAKVKKEWLNPGKDMETSIENKNQGMLSSAGYVAKGCVDDCFVGINIGFIRKIDNNL